MAPKQTNSYPLRVLGTDLSRQSAGIGGVPDVPTNVNPGAEYTAQGFQALQQSAARQQQGIQQLSETSNQITQNAVQANEITARTSAQIAQFAGAKSEQFAKNAAQVSEVITRAYETQVRRQAMKAEEREKLAKKIQAELEAREEKRLKENELLADQQLTELAFNAKDMAAKEGTGIARLRAENQLKKWEGQVRGEWLQTKRQFLYNQIGEERDRQAKAQIEKTQEMERAKKQYNEAGLRMSVDPILRQITASTGDPQELVNQLFETSNRFMVDPKRDVDSLEAMQLMTSMITATTSAAGTSYEARLKLTEAKEKFQTAVDRAWDIRNKLSSGEMTHGQAQIALAEIQLDTGVATGVLEDISDPMSDVEENLRQKDLINKAREDARKGYVSSLNEVEADFEVVGNLVGKLITMGPDKAKRVLESDALRDTALAGEAGDVYKRWQDYNENVTKSNDRLRNIETQRMRIREGNLLNQLRNAKDGTEINAAWGQLGASDPQSIVGQQMRNIDLSQPLQEVAEQMEKILNSERISIEGDLARQRSQLQLYGLQDGLKSRAVHDAKFKARIDQYYSVTAGKAEEEIQGGATPNFSRGSYGSIHTDVSHARGTLNGKPILFPFKSGVVAKITDGYGPAGSPAHGRDRPHAGIDIAAPAGTPIVSPVPGKVTKVGYDEDGYGYYVDVRMGDGRFLRYAHLSEVDVEKGSTIQPGKQLGRVGNTGRSSGPHLHFEVRTKENDYFGGSQDPTSFLQEMAGRVETRRPRGDDTYYQNNYNPYRVTPPGKNLQTLIPKNAVLLPYGAYMMNNQIYDIDKKTLAKAGLIHNRANPVRINAAPSYSHETDVAETNKEKPFGYNTLARDTAFLKAGLQVANRIGVPATWLFDILNFESGFNPAAGNDASSPDGGSGHFGLLQFGPAFRKAYNLTAAAIKSMSRAAQMSLVHNYFKQYAGQINSLAEMYLIVQSPAAYFTWKKTGDASVFHRRDANGSIADHIQKIGRDAGRRYSVPGVDRKLRAMNIIHDKDSHDPNCPVCNQMIASNSDIVPHESYIG